MNLPHIGNILAEIHQVLLALFSILVECVIEKVPLKDSELSSKLGESRLLPLLVVLKGSV